MGEQTGDCSQRERYLRWAAVAGVLVGWGMYRFCQRRWQWACRRGQDEGGVPVDLAVKTASPADFSPEEETESIEITAFAVPDLDELPEAPLPPSAVALSTALEPASVPEEGPVDEEAPPLSEPPHAVEEQVEAPLAPDDLRRIEGIGPKVAALLGDAGITTFAQLAAADPEHLRVHLRAAGLSFMDPTSWPKQAALAASGDWDGLTVLQIGLKGGRRG